MRTILNMLYLSRYYISFDSFRNSSRRIIRKYFFYFAHFLGSLFIKIFYRLEITGQENLTTDEGVLIISNHISFIDFIVLGIIYPKDRFVNFVGKYELYESPIIKFLYNISDVIIPITSKKQSVELQETAFKKITSKLMNNEHVVYFPEGVVTYDGEMDTFKWGFERIKSENPNKLIQPISIKGLEESYFGRVGGLFNWKKLRNEFLKKIEVTIAPSVPAFRWDMVHFEFKVRKMLNKKNCDSVLLPEIRSNGRVDLLETIKCDYFVTNCVENKKRELFIENISLSGFGIQSETEHEVGETIKIFFKEDEQYVYAEVVWCREVGEGSFYSGLRLLECDESDSDLFDLFMKNNQQDEDVIFI